jgi:hypothetical protein
MSNCIALLAGDWLAPESWLKGNVMDHISSARAKYYSDVAFQTDTNCSSNKHRRANPRTFIKVGKDEKGQSQEAFENWPSVAGLRGGGETFVYTWGFLLRAPETQYWGFGICCLLVIQTLHWCIHFPVMNSNEEIYMSQAAFVADRPYPQVTMGRRDSWLQGLHQLPPSSIHKMCSEFSVPPCSGLTGVKVWLLKQWVEGPC